MAGTSHHFSAVSAAQYSARTDNRSSPPALQACSRTGHLGELKELHIASCAGIIHLPDWHGMLEHKELISETDGANCIATTWSSSGIYSWAIFQPL